MSDVTNYDGRLEAMAGYCEAMYKNIAKVNNVYVNSASDVFSFSLPSKYLDFTGIKKIGGKTIIFNQLIDTGTTTVSTVSGHKYYTLIDGTASIITSDGTAITVVDDTADMVCALNPSADAVHKQVREEIFPQLLSLLEDAEYGFIILDMNNSGNGSTITSQDEGEELLTVAKANGFNFANGGFLPWKDTYDDASKGSTVKFSPIDNIIYKDNGKVVFNDFQVMSDESGKLTSDHWPVYADFVLL